MTVLYIYWQRDWKGVYLACVLCFVFVDEIHQKESEAHTHTQTQLLENTNSIIITYISHTARCYSGTCW